MIGAACAHHTGTDDDNVRNFLHLAVLEAFSLSVRTATTRRNPTVTVLPLRGYASMLTQLVMLLPLGQRPLRRGSRASRKPSPSTLKANTTTMIATPGQKDSHMEWYRRSLPVESIMPHEGVGGWVPSPR